MLCTNRDNCEFVEMNFKTAVALLALLAVVADLSAAAPRGKNEKHWFFFFETAGKRAL